MLYLSLGVVVVAGKGLCHFLDYLCLFYIKVSHFCLAINVQLLIFVYVTRHVTRMGLCVCARVNLMYSWFVS